MTATIAALYYVFSHGMRLYQTQLDNQAEISTLSHSLAELESDTLRARVLEKEILKHYQPALVEAFYWGMDEIRRKIDIIESHPIGVDLHAILGRLDEIIDEYQGLFSELEGLLSNLGINEEEGLHGALREAAHAIEHTLDDSMGVARARRLALKASLLMLRRHEKDFIQRQKLQYVQQFNDELRHFSSLLAATPLSFQLRVTPPLNQYRRDFLALTEVQSQIQARQQALNELLRHIPVLMDFLREKMSALEQKRVSLLNEQMQWIDKVLLFLLPVVLIINWLLVFFFWRMERLRQRSEEAMKTAITERELAHTTLNSIGDGVIVTSPQGCITKVNPSAEKILSCRQEEILGRPIPDVVSLCDEETGQPVANPVRTCLDADTVTLCTEKTMLACDNGRRIPIETSAAPIHDHSGTVIGAIMVFRDVTEQREMLRKIQYQASHDTLTGLINRCAFSAELERAWRECQALGAEHVLMYIDLDHFKTVNDTCGHLAGDALLKSLTQLIRRHVRGSDTLGNARQGDQFARLGGDEFALLLWRCPLAVARRIAQEIIYDLKAFSFHWEGKRFNVSASIGLAPMSRDNTSITEVIHNADSACYEAKNRGRGRVCSFTEGEAPDPLRKAT